MIIEHIFRSFHNLLELSYIYTRLSELLCLELIICNLWWCITIWILKYKNITRHGRHSLTIHSDHQVKRRQYFRLGWIALVHFLNSVIHSLFNIQFLSLDFHHLDKVMVVEIEYWNVHFPHSVTHLFIYIIYIYKSADSFWYKIEFKSENSSGIRVCSSNFFIISVWFDLFFFLDSSDEQSADTTIQWSS